MSIQRSVRDGAWMFCLADMFGNGGFPLLHLMIYHALGVWSCEPHCDSCHKIAFVKRRTTVMVHRRLRFRGSMESFLVEIA